MLALVASIHVLNTVCEQRSEDVDGRDKPDHDEEGAAQARGEPPRKDGRHCCAPALDRAVETWEPKAGVDS